MHLQLKITSEIGHGGNLNLRTHTISLKMYDKMLFILQAAGFDSYYK